MCPDMSAEEHVALEDRCSYRRGRAPTGADSEHPKTGRARAASARPHAAGWPHPAPSKARPLQPLPTLPVKYVQMSRIDL